MAHIHFLMMVITMFTRNTFNNGFCFWNNLPGDDFDWTRGNNGTPSVSTGPQFDHSTGGVNGKIY